MNKIIQKFANWLILEKGFPELSLKQDVVLNRESEEGKSSLKSDLLIVNLKENSTLAIIQFKDELDENGIDSHMTTLIANAFNDSLFYIVVPDKSNFKIYEVKDFIINLITLNDFPSYKTMISIATADKKYKKNSIEIDKKRRSDIIKSTISSAGLSLIVGLLISNIFFKENLSSNDLERKKLDSINKSFENTYKELKSKIVNYQKIDSSKQSALKIKDLNIRLSKIEKLIESSPRTLMETQDLNHKIQNVETIISKEKEMYEFKVESLEDKLNTYVSILFTLIVTLIGSIIGLFISSFRK